MKALELRVGAKAAQRLEKEGWHADLIDGLIGASGGPKWLILGRLDRVLISEFLSGRSRPLDAVGSSIGSWRHAAMAQPDPLATYDRFEQAYLSQHYASAKPMVPEITEVALWLMRTLLGDEGEHHVADHPWLRSHIVTARGRGPNGRQPGKRLVAGMGIAALGNALSRTTLRASFQRAVWCSSSRSSVPPSSTASVWMQSSGSSSAPRTCRSWSSAPPRASSARQSRAAPPRGRGPRPAMLGSRCQGAVRGESRKGARVT